MHSRRSQLTVIDDKKQVMQFVHEPDLNHVSLLMLNTWSRPCWEYSPEVLAGYIDRPCGDCSMSVGIYFGDRLAGYIAYFPYLMHCSGKVHPVVFGTWWTVDTRLASKGVAMGLQKEMLQYSRRKEFAGLITFTQADSNADRANRLAFKWLGESLEYKSSFTQMAAITSMARRKLNANADPDVCPYTPAMKEQCLACFYAARKAVDMAVVIQGDDADYIFKERPDTRTWVYRQDGQVCGVINVLEKKVLGQRVFDNAYVEHVAMAGLDETQQRRFMSAVLADPFFDHIDGVCIPAMGHIDEDIFGSMGFYKTSQKFNLFCIPFDERLKKLQVSSFSLDFF